MRAAWVKKSPSRFPVARRRRAAKLATARAARQHDRPLPGKPHDLYPGLAALEPALRLIGQRLWLPGARPELRIAGSALAVPHVAQERGGGPDRDACRQRDRRDKDPEHQDQRRHRGKRSGVRPRRRGRRQRLWLGRRLSIDR